MDQMRLKVSCENCVSACCRAGNALELTPDEAEQLREAGTLLRLMDKAEMKRKERPRRGFGNYLLLSDCGNLALSAAGATYCGDYENRPGICRIFKARSDQCIEKREYFGVSYDGPVSISISPRPDDLG